MVEAEVAHIDPLGVWLGAERVSVLVDSGADYTIIDERYAPLLGVDLGHCMPVTTKVVGGRDIPGRSTALLIGLCGTWIDARVVFQHMEPGEPNLLGREDVFDRVGFAFVGQTELLAAVA